MKFFDILLLARGIFFKNYPFNSENLCSFFILAPLRTFVST